MICPKCGAKLVSGTKYCPICGARQKIQPVSASGQKSGRTGSDYQDYYTEADDYGRSGSRIRRADEDDLYGGSSGAAYSAGRRTRRQSSRQAIVQDCDHLALGDRSHLHLSPQCRNLVQFDLSVLTDVLIDPFLDFRIDVGNLDRHSELKSFLIYKIQ